PPVIGTPYRIDMRPGGQSANQQEDADAAEQSRHHQQAQAPADPARRLKTGTEQLLEGLRLERGIERRWKGARRERARRQAGVGVLGGHGSSGPPMVLHEPLLA